MGIPVGQLVFASQGGGDGGKRGLRQTTMRAKRSLVAVVGNWAHTPRHRVLPVPCSAHCWHRWSCAGRVLVLQEDRRLGICC